MGFFHEREKVERTKDNEKKKKKKNVRFGDANEYHLAAITAPLASRLRD